MSRDATDGPDVLPLIEAMNAVSLGVPDAEPISVWTENAFNLVPPVRGYRAVAICKSKVSQSLHPRVALLVFISRMRALADRLGPQALIVIAEEEQEIGDVRAISHGFRIMLGSLAFVESPLWVSWWLARRFR